jgi:uncharacterized protein
MPFKRAKKAILFSLFTVTPLSAAEYAPWGKDAEMQQKSSTSSRYFEIVGFDSIIDFHRKVISDADGPRSHFFPSSSEYMRQACLKYGFFSGFSLGCDRLIRENDERWIYPLFYTKDGDYLKRDPVP